MEKLLNKVALILRLAAYDFKAAYAGSVLGSLWSVAEPLITVVVYWFVYTVAFGGNDVNGVPYYIWLSVGIAPWFFVSNGLKNVAASFRDYSYMLKKMYFDKRILIGVRTVSALATHMIFLLIVIVVCIMNSIVPDFGFLIFIVGLTTVFVYATGRIMALLCGKCKDMLNVVAVVLNIGFWITPVFWRVDMIDESLSKIIMFNPIAVITEIYRAVIIPQYYINKSGIIYLVVVCFVLIAVGKCLEKIFLPDITDGL